MINAKSEEADEHKEISDFVTLESFLSHVPISERTLHRYLAAGRLRAYKLDGKLIFNTADIETFLKRRSVAAAPLLLSLKIANQTRHRADSRVLNDKQSKDFFDGLSIFVRPDWKPETKSFFEL